MFKDFAGFTTSQPDPVISYTRAGATLTSGAVGAAWTRPYVGFTPDRDSKFMVVGARVGGPTQATVGSEHLASQYFTNWQLETAIDSGVPTAYSPAREVQLTVLPDRVNLVVNPSMVTDTVGWVTGANCTLSRATTSWTPLAGSLSMSSNSNTTMSATTSPTYKVAVTPGTSYTVQARFRPNTTTRNVRVGITWQDSAGAVLSTTSSVDFMEVSGDWVMPYLTAVAPVGSAFCVVNLTVRFAGTTGEVHFVDAIMLEKTADLLPYFDGSYGEDNVWQGTANLSYSYFYENRIDRAEAIRRALRDAVPMGIGVAAAKFGSTT